MMPVGVLTDCSCVLVGGLLGTVLGSRFTPALREKLTMVLGFASVAIGINSIVKANQMTPVVIAVIFGTLLGELLHSRPQWSFQQYGEGCPFLAYLRSPPQRPWCRCP